MSGTETKPALGTARCPGESYDDLAAQDTKAVPDFLKEDAYQYLGSEPLSTARYTSPEFFRREIDKMWPNVWQFAARDEELPEPGDVVLYENAGRSYLLVRQQDGSVRAMHNVCLHRGRKLRDASGWAENLRCPFHGFTWNLDGTLKDVPCPWDFPHLGNRSMALPQAQVAHWSGYIFIKENPAGPTLEEFLHPLPTHHKRWAHEECVTTLWVAKVVKANWKTCAEAFMEAFHSVATHPQILPFAGDANTKYFTYGDHVNLAITPFAVTSPHLNHLDRGEDWIIEQMLKYNGRSAATGLKVDIPEGGTARAALAAVNRERYGKADRRDYSEVSDSEMVDAFTYNVFPNFAPWGGFPPNIVYRWRPWPDQDTTLMEVRRLTRVPVGEPRPRSVPMRLLRDDEPWASHEEMAVQGAIFDQDWDNLPSIHQGMKASKTGMLQLSAYQEIRIRHFAQTLDKYLARS
jgi:phenylpropionate dioxygenase-like ring-hydroxylating dioxygenase large terminal subunit